VQTLLQWKTVSITHYVCVFVPLIIQHAMHMYHVFCGLSDSTVLFTILSQRVRISKKIIEHTIRVLVFSTTFSGMFLNPRSI